MKQPVTLMPWEMVVSKSDLKTLHMLAFNVAGYRKTILHTKIEEALLTAENTP